MTVAVAGMGLLFPGCEGVEAFAARLRGGQSAGPLPRRAGETPGDALARVLRAVVGEAVRDAGREAARGPAVVVGLGEVASGGAGRGPSAGAPGPDVPGAARRGAPGAVGSSGPGPCGAGPVPGPTSLGADAGSGPAGIRPGAPGSTPDVAGALAAAGWTGAPRAAGSVAEALEAAFGAIAAGAEAALVAAVAVGDRHPPGAPGAPFSIALEAGGAAPPPSEGAAALVLTCEHRRPRGRARLTGLAGGAEPGARGLAAALDPRAGLVLADGRRASVITEATALGRVFGEGPRRAALASARAWLGDAGAASDLAGVLAAALCLERRMRPTLPGWDAPGPVVLRGAGGLLAQDEAAFWPAAADAPVRRAAVLLGGAVAALEGGPGRPPASVTAHSEGRPALVPLAAADRRGIEDGLRSLEAALDAGQGVPRIARRALARAAPDAPLRVAVVASDPRELRREAGFMRRALDKAEGGRSIRTPGGSVLAPRPMGPRGAVAFVYPGNGSAYLGLGREITLAFAGHLAAVEPLFDHRLPELMGTAHVQPVGLTRPTEAERERLEERLNRDMAILPLVGVAYSILHTQLMHDVLDLGPAMALGYSVGECAMRAALGQWPDWRGLERMLRHPALLEGVSGPMTAVRRFWAERGADPGEPPWAAHYVRAGAEALAPHLGPEAFVQSVLSPGETILCGAPRACDAALARVGAPSLRLGFDMAVHAPPTRLIRADLEALCDQPVEPRPRTTFYSAHGCAPVPQAREATARTLAAMLSEPVDFRALVERAHADGARVFVEMGVRNACTGWIGATLEGREHLAVAVDVKGLPGDAAWMRAVAQLWAHRVPLDLRGLAGGAPAAVPAEAVA